MVRETTPTPLSTVNRTLRRDVSIIACKCLKKDRGRRYASASELGADIGRYLVGEPILAAPPSFFDSLRRLAHRHRAAVAALAGTFVALALAVAGISLFYPRAEQQRQRAIVDRNRAVEKEAEAQIQAAEANRQRLRSSRIAVACSGIRSTATSARPVDIPTTFAPSPSVPTARSC